MDTSTEIAKAPKTSVAEGSAVSAPSEPALVWRPTSLARALLGIAGAALLVGFFMPWVQLGDLATLTGLELVISNNILLRDSLGSSQRLLFAVCPIAGLALLFLALRGHRLTRYVATISGLTVLGVAIVTALGLFLKITHSGLWIVLLGAFVALFAGLAVSNAPRLRR